VTLDGEDVTRWGAARRARAGVSRSFQTLDLFDDLTVLENLRAASDPRAWWAPLADLVWPRTPPLSGEVVSAIRAFGLEDFLGRRVKDLSSGQRRLLSIARAAAARPSVLLLDEPAAGLGEHESAELASLVRTLPDDWGMAVLLVEHDMNFVMQVCDHLVVLDFGIPIADGPPVDVRSDAAVITAYLGAPEDEAPLVHDGGRAGHLVPGPAARRPPVPAAVERSE
jgi:sulfate-transporting ATPase